MFYSILFPSILLNFLCFNYLYHCMIMPVFYKEKNFLLKLLDNLLVI